tara:strand:+ start:2201 stop:2527 length:327 start_codon:yes stop_codon:yes gene_type:complete
MEFDPKEFGLVEDGSTIEVVTLEVQEGRMEEIVEVFQEVFSDFKPEGFSVIFSAVDLAHNKLIWIHRYEKGFDLSKRFYLGKYPKLVFCCSAGSRYDVREVSYEEITS